ncbi:MAG: PfkB family carbohydrate kinase [Solirubrobacteraceae bacterium]
MGARYDYVAVGHVTLDVIEDHPGGRRSQPGGGAFYSALQAARLGLRSLVVTKGVPAEIEAVLAPFREEIDVYVLPAKSTTTLATWGAGGERVQRVRAWAGPIEEPLAERLAVQASIVHFAPVARETTSQTWIDEAFVGLTPQGLVRSWDPNQPIRSSALQASMLPRRLDAVVLSENERDDCASLLDPGAAAGGAVIAVTAGARPIELRLADGSTTQVQPAAVDRARDDLGAGDVFAAAFFVALQRAEPAASAARFASAAAAVRIAGEGPAAIGRRQDVERLLSGLDG